MDSVLHATTRSKTPKSSPSQLGGKGLTEIRSGPKRDDLRNECVNHQPAGRCHPKATIPGAQSANTGSERGVPGETADPLKVKRGLSAGKSQPPKTAAPGPNRGGAQTESSAHGFPPRSRGRQIIPSDLQGTGHSGQSPASKNPVHDST